MTVVSGRTTPKFESGAISTGWLAKGGSAAAGKDSACARLTSDGGVEMLPPLYLCQFGAPVLKEGLAYTPSATHTSTYYY